MNESEVFAAIGREGVENMVRAFYKRVPDDDLMGPMYPKHDLSGAEERLCDFMMMRLGGDTAYTEKRGHPRLRMRHMPFKIGIAERDRWMKLMVEAMDEVGIEENAKQWLTDFFFQVADFMRNQPEPGQFREFKI